MVAWRGAGVMSVNRHDLLIIQNINIFLRVSSLIYVSYLYWVSESRENVVCRSSLG